MQIRRNDSGLAKAGVAYAAAIWALIFAVFHVIWACGWYVGLDQEQAHIAFQKPLFYAYDVVVAVLCAFAALIALAPVRPWGRRLPLGLLRICAWVGTALLVIRSGASVIQGIYLLARGRFTLEDMGVWEPWFYLGAVLFGVSTWRYWRRPRDTDVV